MCGRGPIGMTSHNVIGMAATAIIMIIIIILVGSEVVFPPSLARPFAKPVINHHFARAL